MNPPPPNPPPSLPAPPLVLPGGVLAVSRSFGNRMLKQFIIPHPEICDLILNERERRSGVASARPPGGGCRGPLEPQPPPPAAHQLHVQNKPSPSC